VTIGPILHALAALLLAAPDDLPDAASFPRCDPVARHCFGLHLYVAGPADAPVVGHAWLALQLREANRLFAPSGIGFEVEAVDRPAEDRTRVHDKTARDALGRERYARGTIHVFVVERLDDVDVEGEEIRGVHWRDRADRSRRWIILSGIAPQLVLAHELGHYFGLAHSRERGSVMSKAPNDPTPYLERAVLPREQARIAAYARRYTRDGTLRQRSPPAGVD
jgi:hypothetical protein